MHFYAHVGQKMLHTKVGEKYNTHFNVQYTVSVHIMVSETAEQRSCCHAYTSKHVYPTINNDLPYNYRSISLSMVVKQRPST
jgi:hypothetical protein